MAVFIASEIMLSKTYTAVERQFAVPAGAEADPEIIAEGGRLAKVRGCYGGCHGPGGEGSDLMGGFIAPNLTRLARDYSDTELEVAIRQGLRRDGTSLFAMSSDAFQYLSDDDLANIIVFFRALPEDPNDPGPQSFGLMIRGAFFYFDIIKGGPLGAAERIAAVDFDVPSGPEVRGDPVAFGRYLAMSICAECHGLALQGERLTDYPDLIVASAYSAEEFRHLMATGEAPDGRDLGLMAAMGRRRFSHLNPEEADAIHAYLTSDEFMMEERE